MTHGFTYNIVFKSEEWMHDLKHRIIDDKEFRDLYLLKRGTYDKHSFRQYSDQQPFIKLPTGKETWNDGTYRIWITTGNHVGWEDDMYLIQWWYFICAFRHRYMDEIKQGCEKEYIEQWGREKYSLKEFEVKLREGSNVDV